MAVKHDMAHSFDVADALPVKTDEGGEFHRAPARHRQASRYGIKEGSTCPPWPLADVGRPARLRSPGVPGLPHGAGSGLADIEPSGDVDADDVELEDRIIGHCLDHAAHPAGLDPP